MKTTTAPRLGELIDTTELSEHLGVPEATLTDWRYRGKGPQYMKIGKHIRYSVATVEAWLASQVKG